jgi:hypothetical protein
VLVLEAKHHNEKWVLNIPISVARRLKFVNIDRGKKIYYSIGPLDRQKDENKEILLRTKVNFVDRQPEKKETNKSITGKPWFIQEESSLFRKTRSPVKKRKKTGSSGKVAEEATCPTKFPLTISPKKHCSVILGSQKVFGVPKKERRIFVCFTNFTFSGRKRKKREHI